MTHTHETDRLAELLQLRSSINAAIDREARRQGLSLPTPASKGVGYVLVPPPSLREAAAQIAAAAERWAVHQPAPRERLLWASHYPPELHSR